MFEGITLLVVQKYNTTIPLPYYVPYFLLDHSKASPLHPHHGHLFYIPLMFIRL